MNTLYIFCITGTNIEAIVHLHTYMYRYLCIFGCHSDKSTLLFHVHSLMIDIFKPGLWEAPNIRWSNCGTSQQTYLCILFSINHYFVYEDLVQQPASFISWQCTRCVYVCLCHNFLQFMYTSKSILLLTVYSYGCEGHIWG